jgi:DNA polymerase V
MAERKRGSYPAEFAQVCNLAEIPASDLEAVFAATAVGDVWGVGRRIGAQLEAEGICTVLDLARMSPAMARARWSVLLEKTVRELQGQPCMQLDEVPAAKKEIACTRSFGRPIRELSPLIEAVSAFATRVGEKLRKQNSVAGQVLVFLHTSPHRPGPRFAQSMVVPLRRPSADTTHLVGAAVAGLRAIYKPGYDLSKAGVMLLDLMPESMGQGELDLEEDDLACDRTRLMSAMDALNERFGKGTLTVASAGTATQLKDWSMRQDRKTPNYTTDWNQLAIARA